jgi:Fic family protein
MRGATPTNSIERAFSIFKRGMRALEKRIGDRQRPNAFNHRQSWLLNELARNRLTRVTVAEHLKRHGVSYLTARKDLETLVEVGYLEKRRLGKTAIYRPAKELIKVLTT